MSKFQQAESALCWLRGWSSPKNVVTEFKKLKESYTKSPDNSDCTKTRREIYSSRLSSIRDNISTYLHKSFYVPLLLICLLFTLHSCTGFNPRLIDTIVIFRQIDAPMDSHAAATILDALCFLGAILFIVCVHFTGKKKLMFVTLTGAGLAYITVSAALLLRDHQIYQETCQWVAAVAMIFEAFLTSAAIDKVVFILNAEIFPTKYRNIGAGLDLFTYTILQAITNKIFLSLLEAVTLPGIFILFGVSCIITCIMFHFMFPETEGKTLQEIENHYEDVEKLA